MAATAGRGAKNSRSRCCSVADRITIDVVGRYARYAARPHRVTVNTSSSSRRHTEQWLLAINSVNAGTQCGIAGVVIAAGLVAVVAKISTAVTYQLCHTAAICDASGVQGGPPSCASYDSGATAQNNIAAGGITRHRISTCSQGNSAGRGVSTGNRLSDRQVAAQGTDVYRAGRSNASHPIRANRQGPGIHIDQAACICSQGADVVVDGIKYETGVATLQRQLTRHNAAVGPFRHRASGIQNDTAAVQGGIHRQITGIDRQVATAPGQRVAESDVIGRTAGPGDRTRYRSNVVALLIAADVQHCGMGSGHSTAVQSQTAKQNIARVQARHISAVIANIRQ